MAVLVCYWTKTGRVSWWAVDADPKAFQPQPHETIIEMPAAEYGKIHPQAFVSRETGLIPDDDDRFVEVDARGEPVRVFFQEPDKPRGARVVPFKQFKADRAPKGEPLPSRPEPYTS